MRMMNVCASLKTLKLLQQMMGWTLTRFQHLCCQKLENLTEIDRMGTVSATTSAVGMEGRQSIEAIFLSAQSGLKTRKSR